MSRADIEAKFRELQGDLQDVEQDARSYVGIAIAVGIGVVALAAFVLGRRRGRRRSTWVEIRRV